MDGHCYMINNAEPMCETLLYSVYSDTQLVYNKIIKNKPYLTLSPFENRTNSKLTKSE